MVRKSSDPESRPEPNRPVGAPDRRDAPVFLVASDDAFLEAVRGESPTLPSGSARFKDITSLAETVAQLERLPLAFALIVERDGRDVDIHALRQLRVDCPQLVIFALVGKCDQQSLLRLQSIGVHRVLLPPFSEIDLGAELATAVPNVNHFKRHPGVMMRAQARLDMLIPSDLSYVLGVNHEIALLLKEFAFPPQDVRVNIPLVCDEAITNAIIHGNRSDPAKMVNIQVYVSRGRFRIRVRDQGPGFDAGTVDDPREGENIMRSGGRGVFLMRSIMDSVEYKEGGRVLEMEKRNTNSTQNGNGG
jgi:serine/threonine-protein kinase RsbW